MIPWLLIALVVFLLTLLRVAIRRLISRGQPDDMIDRDAAILDPRNQGWR